MFAFRSRLRKSSVWLIGAALTAALIGCGSNNNNAVPGGLITSYGPPTPVGNGQARAFITSRYGVPTTIGIEMTAASLTNLPIVAFNSDHVYSFTLPPGIGISTIKDIALDWTNGHVPIGQGDVPHFHPSFFLITPQQRLQITVDNPVSDAPVDPTELPANHIHLGMVVPTEGSVYFEPVLPGYREHPFTTTNYNINFFNGHMVLIQTGATLAFLQSKQDYEMPLEQPQKYPAPGYYPTSYRFTYDSGRNVYVMSIGSFVKR